MPAICTKQRNLRLARLVTPKVTGSLVICDNGSLAYEHFFFFYRCKEALFFGSLDIGVFGTVDDGHSPLVLDRKTPVSETG